MGWRSNPANELLMLACAITCSATPLHAKQHLSLAPSAGLGVTAGLDSKTRELIERMPPELRKQAFEFLKDALPLIDGSVHSYLEHVSKIVDTQIDHMACAATGAAAAMGSALKHAVVGVEPKPVSSLQTDWGQMQKAFSDKTSPKEYQTGYADFLVLATTAACQVATTPEARILVAKIVSEARQSWITWSRLEGSCQNADVCVASSLKAVTRLIQASDERDLTSAEARTRVARVTAVPKRGFLRAFNQRPYEDRLRQLLAIQDGVEVARKARESLAQQYMDSANVYTRSIRDRLRDANKRLSNVNVQRNEESKRIAQSTLSLERDVNDALQSAVRLMASLSPAASVVRDTLTAFSKRRGEVVSSAARRSARIRVQNMLRRVNFPR